MHKTYVQATVESRLSQRTEESRLLPEWRGQRPTRRDTYCIVSGSVSWMPRKVEGSEYTKTEKRELDKQKN